MSIYSETEMIIYCSLMEEIKDRSQIAAHKLSALKGIPDNTVNRLVETESVILQIRFICELIALASLVAHNTLGLPTSLLKSWNAEKTLKHLSSVNPDCFPRPITLKRTAPNKLTLISHILDLDKDALCKLYSECGRMLHRGVVLHILNDKPQVHDLKVLEKWIKQLDELLKVHLILFSKQNTSLIVTMFTQPDGRVTIGNLDGAGDGPLII